MVKLYRIMNDVLKDLREESFELLKTFLMAAYIQRLNQSYNAPEDKIYGSIKKYQETIISQLQGHLIRSLNQSINFHQMIWKRKKAVNIEEKKIRKTFEKNFWNFSVPINKHNEIRELFNLK